MSFVILSPLYKIFRSKYGTIFHKMICQINYNHCIQTIIEYISNNKTIQDINHDPYSFYSDIFHDIEFIDKQDFLTQLFHYSNVVNNISIYYQTSNDYDGNTNDKDRTINFLNKLTLNQPKENLLKDNKLTENQKPKTPEPKTSEPRTTEHRSPEHRTSEQRTTEHRTEHRTPEHRTEHRSEPRSSEVITEPRTTESYKELNVEDGEIPLKEVIKHNDQILNDKFKQIKRRQPSNEYGNYTPIKRRRSPNKYGNYRPSKRRKRTITLNKIKTIIGSFKYKTKYSFEYTHNILCPNRGNCSCFFRGYIHRSDAYECTCPYCPDRYLNVEYYEALLYIDRHFEYIFESHHQSRLPMNPIYHNVKNFNCSSFNCPCYKNNN